MAHIDGAVFAHRRSLFKPFGALGVIKGRVASAKVCPRTKGAFTAACDDHRAHRVITVCNVERGDHFLHHLTGERVHPVRTVERDGEDALADFGEDGGEIGHCIGSLSLT